MSKVTMQSIANSLGISRVSVFKALNNQSGVSKSLQEKVIATATEMGYFKTHSTLAMPKTKNIQTVALVVARPNSSTFWTNIIHRLAQELSKHNINMLYTYIPTEYTPDFTLPSALTNGSVQGAIVLNIYDSRLFSLISDLPIPTVFLDCVPGINEYEIKGDLFLIEGHYSEYAITESVLQTGVQHIGFIGDIEYARTNLDRYNGFCHCLKDYRIPLEPKFCKTESMGIFTYNKELYRFLDSLSELPEAFICANDDVAHYLELYFSENSNRIPNGIIITGFDGSNEYPNVNGLITTANVKTSQLGKRLSTQIIYRMEHSDAPYELTYIKPDIIYHKSIIKSKEHYDFKRHL